MTMRWRTLGFVMLIGLLCASSTVAADAPGKWPWRISRLAVTDKPHDLKQVQALLIAIYRQRNSIDDVIAYAEERGAKCSPVRPVPREPDMRYTICKKYRLLIYEMRMVVSFDGPRVEVFADTDANVP